jgi:hypothetical protein
MGTKITSGLAEPASCRGNNAGITARIAQSRGMIENAEEVTTNVLEFTTAVPAIRPLSIDRILRSSMRVYFPQSLP